MMKLSFQLFIQIVNTLVYCILFAVGCYFIYQGQVIQRYTLGRTNFAEFEEELEEFPTLVFFIDNGDKNRTYKYGTDFTILYSLEAYSRLGNSYTTLSIGENKLPGTSLRLDLEPFSNARLHKITPLNFNKSMPLS